MKTSVIRINPQKIEISKIEEAVKLIKKGGLVAFPTETVYGLGADAFNSKAVAKIFEVKQRPLNDPLIVHIADKQDLFKVAKKVNRLAGKLIDKFWPGPLTLVLEKSSELPDIVTAGLDTVAVRMPAHPVALSLIREAKTPLAAPSANLSGKPSPTTAEHVLEDLKDKIDLVIEAGKTELGVESTILDLTQKPFSILRLGGVSWEELRAVVPQVKLAKKEKILAPGMFKGHYSPQAKLIVVEEGKKQVERVKELVHKFLAEGKRVGVMAKGEDRFKYRNFKVKVLGKGDDLRACAGNLFSLLREFEREKFEVIVVEGVKEKGLGRAIMERLRKAEGR
ncbi:MAG: L-threonylcarbamoyladenylate synthase [Candidatus Omnitrophica bacterium]|nr:L-threonylcarbamoyladenylate synthase [Candidatus Omnitrophota bacterium]MCM8798315.1 L-threonylcarbamoyladenylate synthase [Candidatus Omnitrophota bacterium]